MLFLNSENVPVIIKKINKSIFYLTHFDPVFDSSNSKVVPQLKFMTEAVKIVPGECLALLYSLVLWLSIGDNSGPPHHPLWPQVGLKKVLPARYLKKKIN